MVDLRVFIEALRECLSEPPLELSEKSRKEIVKTAQKKADKYGVRLRQHYAKDCSMKAFRHNVQYFYRVKGTEWEGSKGEKLRRAIAASYSTLRNACGIPSDAPKMTPKQMVGGE